VIKIQPANHRKPPVCVKFLSPCQISCNAPGGSVMCTRSAERTITRHVSLFAAFNYVEIFQHFSHPHHSTLTFNTPLQWFNTHSTPSFNTIVNGLKEIRASIFFIKLAILTNNFYTDT
jgi:hypothetical protein